MLGQYRCDQARDLPRRVGAIAAVVVAAEVGGVEAERVVVASGGICGGDLSKVRASWYAPWGMPPKVLLNGAHRYGDGLLPFLRKDPAWPHPERAVNKGWWFPVLQLTGYELPNPLHDLLRIHRPSTSTSASRPERVNTTTSEFRTW